jgi:putative redox protein
VRAKKARLFAIVGANCCNAAELADQNEKMCDLLAMVCASAQSPFGFYLLGYHLGRASACQATTSLGKIMDCRVTWTGAAGTRSGMGFLAETGSGHMVAMDGAPDAAKPENGGQNLAPRPMEMLLAGAGGCTAYDVVLILKRGRHDVRGCSVKLSSERAEVDPKVFTRINMHFTVTAKGVPLP